jgi:hypothetical protein
MPISTVGLTNAVNGILPVANGGTGSSTGIFPTGTAMLFQQTTAPTGWTKVTTYNNYALRIVSGSASSGGSVGFTTAFSSQNVGATTLTTGQIPNHYHQVFMSGFAGTLGIQVRSSGGDSSQYAFADVADLPHYTTPAGSGSGMFANNDNGGGGSHTHSLNIAVQYVDVIIATKD